MFTTTCRYRGPEVSEGRSFCGNHTCWTAPEAGVSEEDCNKCEFPDKSCGDEPSMVFVGTAVAQHRLDGATKLQTCQFAGRAIRGKKEVCRTCGGNKELQVFACAKIGETHAGKCGPCQLYEPKAP